MTRSKTPWLGPNNRPEKRPVRTRNPTPEQVAETVLQELRDPGYLVSFYEGDKIDIEKALSILSNAVLNKEQS